MAGGAPPLVVPLGAVGRRDLALVGGKGANLGERIRAGFPMPPGFVITTAAYNWFVNENRLDTTLARVLHGRAGDGTAIRMEFERVPIPRPVEQSILDGYRQLGGRPTAVRSSATAEAAGGGVCWPTGHLLGRGRRRSLVGCDAPLLGLALE